VEPKAIASAPDSDGGASEDDVPAVNGAAPLQAETKIKMKWVVYVFMPNQWS
jgi:hypothetical protein